MAARSDALVEWMMDEDDELKRNRAFEDMAGILVELYGFNLYIGIESTRNHYSVGVGFIQSEIQPVAVLDIDDPHYAWYFDCMASEWNYSLNIGIDSLLQRKRVWLNYKVILDGNTLGVISTGLEFSHIVGELFSNYDSAVLRGLIVDRSGAVLMDSSLIEDAAFLYGDLDVRIDEVLQNPDILAAIESYTAESQAVGLRLARSEGYSMATGMPQLLMLSSGPYRYMTVTHIESTDWSVVILSGSTSLFEMAQFIPILLTVLILLIVVALVTSAANYRLIFLPLGKLGRSLASLRESQEVHVYGVERNDEVGELSKTIQDLFTKANVDALTGIYNRRFMENNLEHVMGMLTRANGVLSVLMLDIDYFKRYNDTYGHDQGDECLRAVAHALAGGISRASDFVARYGGEEFIAILPNTEENGARSIAEKLLKSVRELNLTHEGNDAAPYVTVSIGVTTGSVEFGHGWQEFVKHADEALYMAKQMGRNQYSFLEM
jgi:diguanylate cyclase (GGDEF)-like protein